MFKVAIFFVLMAAALAYEGAPLDYKGQVIDTKDVLIAKEKHYAAWDEAAHHDLHHEHEGHYDPHHGHEGHYDPHYEGHYDLHADPHYMHRDWVEPDHKW